MFILQKLNTVTIIGSMLLASTLYSAQYDLNSGWNLVGLGETSKVLNPSDVLDVDKKIIWKYESDKWQAYSNDDGVNKDIVDASYGLIDTINPKEGFWIYTDTNTSFNSVEVSQQKTLVSNYSQEVDISSENYSDYTYNYVKGSGVAVSQYIDWNSAQNISDGEVVANALAKPVSLALFSSDASVALSISDTNCNESYTM